LALYEASAYLVCVIHRLIRLCALLAMMLMPLSMTQPAAASDRSAAPMAATAMGESHCPDGSAHHDGKAMPGECTMACASALPALEQPDLAIFNVVAARLEPPVLERLAGILLDIATPPPRDA
jgi:hypothetical protein